MRTPVLLLLISRHLGSLSHHTQPEASARVHSSYRSHHQFLMCSTLQWLSSYQWWGFIIFYYDLLSSGAKTETFWTGTLLKHWTVMAMESPLCWCHGDDVFWVEFNLRYTKWYGHLTLQQSFPSLSELQELSHSRHFLWCHKSYEKCILPAHIIVNQHF